MTAPEAAVTGLATVDAAIVLGFLVVVTLVGYYMSNVASQGIEDYFLGSNKIPWWVLGISTATSNFDMTGTMIIVAMVYEFGYRGFLIEMRGGVGLALAFLMVFLGKWLRRSRVMTSAQWMKIRFGTDDQGKTAHLLSAIAQCLFSLGMIVYFCVGGGKFLEYFLPYSKTTCTAIMVAVGLTYTLMSGIYGVVFTDVIQMIILSFAAIYLSVKGFNSEIHGIVSQSWLGLDLAFPDDLKTSVMARHVADAAKTAELEQLTSFFGVFVLFYVAKSTIEGMSGVGGYTDQRFFAARNEREAGLLTLESIVISVLRWTMVAGLAALGLAVVHGNDPALAHVADIISQDPEMTLPAVISAMVPVGIKGIMLAGLIAAAMSTFDSTLNAGASYLVIDIYQSYINPKADMKQLVKASHVATIALAVVGVLIAAIIPNINIIWDWITMALSAGMFMPLFLRWYWPRFNGYGFAAGTAGGMIAAVIVKGGFSTLPIYVSFPTIMGISFVFCVLASLMTPPVEEKVLLDFWLKINPGGAWKAYGFKAIDEGYITRQEMADRQIEKLNDTIATCLAVPFQISILITSMAVVFHDWEKVGIFGLITVVTGVGLYLFWFSNLKMQWQCDEDDKRFGGDEVLRLDQIQGRRYGRRQREGHQHNHKPRHQHHREERDNHQKREERPRNSSSEDGDAPRQRRPRQRHHRNQGPRRDSGSSS